MQYHHKSYFYVWNIAPFLSLHRRCVHYYYNSSIYICSFAMPRKYWINPGPKKLKKNSLSVYYWNLNGLSTHNFSKLTQLKACISIYKHMLVCLSETYLYSSIPDSLLEIHRYSLIRLDHPNDMKIIVNLIHFWEVLRDFRVT